MCVCVYFLGAVLITLEPYRRKRDSPKLRLLKGRLAAKLASKAHDAARPADLRAPEQFGLPYRLQGLSGASLARTAVASLKKKNADCNYISELCNAAEHESGNQMSWVTKTLGGRSTEKRFHQFFSRSLPRVSTIMLPLVTSRKKKTAVIKPCRILVELQNLFILILKPEAPTDEVHWAQSKASFFQALICHGCRGGPGS